MARQLGLDLPAREALGREDFMIAPSNAAAASMVDAWRSWPGGKLVLSGPPGSGKTHLSHVWARESGARVLRAAALDTRGVGRLLDAPAAVEDVDAAARDGEALAALFHLHNALRAAGHPLLMTGARPPGLWRLALPDLQSRVDAAAHAALRAPDDDLLAAVLAKLFADRQLVPRADVIPYLLARMERSFDAARAVAARLDAASLALGRPVTRALARECLDNPRPPGG